MPDKKKPPLGKPRGGEVSVLLKKTAILQERDNFFVLCLDSFNARLLNQSNPFQDSEGFSERKIQRAGAGLPKLNHHVTLVLPQGYPRSRFLSRRLGRTSEGFHVGHELRLWEHGYSLLGRQKTLGIGEGYGRGLGGGGLGHRGFLSC